MNLQAKKMSGAVHAIFLQKTNLAFLLAPL